MYNRKEIYENALKYFSGNELAADVWCYKYALRKKDDDKVFLEKSPEDTINRLVEELYRIEQNYHNPTPKEKFYEVLNNFKHIILGGSAIFGVGNTEALSSLANCFVIGSEIDSYGSICLIDQELVQLSKRRGGVGTDLSHLRPAGASVNGAARTSTGAVSFAPRYSHSTREVAQNGRRGALMLTFDIKHPDADKFINLKSDKTTCTGANISLKVDNDFMISIRDKKEKYKQCFPIDSLNPTVTKETNPQLLWKDFCKNNWNFAEPGLIFWDTLIKESLPDCYVEEGFRTVSTNPCGEIPLCQYDSCRLTAVNFYSYVVNPFSERAYFDWNKFQEHVKIAMRIMDNIVDLENEKINQIINYIQSEYEEHEVAQIEINLWKKIQDKLLRGRRTGLGMMGGADMLAALGYKYGTPEATEVLAYTFRMFAIAAYESSIQMAHERGAFPIWSQKKENENPFLKRILTELNSEGLYNFIEKYHEFGRRNIACLTVAPTGTISIEAQTSGGFEPVFMLYYNRNKKVNPEDKNVRVDFTDEVGDSWQRYTVVHKPFEDWYRQNKEWLEHYVLHNRLPEVEDMTIEDWDQVASYSPYYKATANEIDVYEKIRMQGQVQRWIDHSISITHNLPADFPLEEISKIYLTAWEAGCKGCTIYRDGSRTGVLTKIEEKKEEGFNYKDALKRPQKVETDIYCITALREKWIVLVGKVNDKPYEIFSFPKRNISKDVFLQLFDIVDEKPVPKKDMKYEVEKVDKRVYKLNRTNHECKCLIEDIVSLMENDSDRSDTKRISLELRHGIDPKFISQTIEKQYKDMTAFDNAIARVLKLYIKNGEEYGKCPECKKGKMIYQNGCPTCSNCGHSKCS